MTTALQISAAIGLAAMGTISSDYSRVLAADGRSFADALSGGYQLAFTIAAACVAVGLLVVLVVLRSPRRAALPESLDPEHETEAEAA